MTKKHSDFSASGAERWFNCPGSVRLSRGLPDKSSVWAEEGTLAHSILEYWLSDEDIELPEKLPQEMRQLTYKAAEFILKILDGAPDAYFLVETRVPLDFIHPEAFGTFDAGIVDLFGVLHIFDFKYGAGVSVSPIENLQMIFYGLALAHRYNWNFKKARLWIIQPRIKGYDGPTYWDIPILILKNYVEVFKNAVKQVEQFPTKYVEGGWCHWCKAKSICPLKQEVRLEKGKDLFKKNPVDKKSRGSEDYF
jgi:hypothetical protein